MSEISAEPRVRRLQDLPSPRALPLLGNALQLDPARLHLVLEDWCRQFGETYTFGLGPQRITMLLHKIEDIRGFFANDLRFLEQF